MKKEPTETKPKLLLSFDLEEYQKAGEKGFEIGYEGGKIVKDLLERTGVVATFFVTGTFYQRFPEFVKELSESHEIAFHGLNHADDYQSMPEDAAIQNLLAGKTRIEKELNLDIEGFRAPRMRPPSYDVLRKVRFLYSSSLHPTYVPGRYNHLRSPRIPFIRHGVLELPVSVTAGIRLPLSWVWFRQGGLAYAKTLTLLIRTSYLAIYFHPWEFVPLTGSFIHTRNTGKKMENALEQFLAWIVPKRNPMKMVEYARKFLAEDSRVIKQK
jgi:peptidoglycan/xylan/chitin deacetylase (PgdA/CDA1 family)